jgi:hypothetical protein
MSVPQSCNPCCSTTTTTQIPGPAGADASALTPIAGITPEGVQIAVPGQTILCTTDSSFWIKQTGTGSTGWIKLIGLWMFLCFALSGLAQPILRNPLDTNNTLTALLVVSNIANAQIAADTSKMPASLALTNLSLGIGTGLTNVQPLSTNLNNLSTNAATVQTLAGVKFTGIVTNLSTIRTNVMYFTNGILIWCNTNYP